MDWAPTAGLVLIAASAVLPGSSPWAVVLLWLVIIAEEVAAGLMGRWSNGPPSIRSKAARRARLPRPLNDAVEFDEPLASQILAQQTRRRGAGGREVIHGTLHATLSTGQRVAVEHIVFCPMFDRIPQVSAEILGELEGSVRATHVYRYGARLEVKLREPCDEPLDLGVRYEAHG
jgi:hypothetical protein